MTGEAADRLRVVRSLAAVNDRLGLRQRIRSLDYFRCLEVVLALRGLDLREGSRILDMGCGDNPFPLALAAACGARVCAFDLDPRALSWQRRGAARLALTADRFRTVRGDSRRLPFAEGSFDRVLNLSSIEHIPAGGDLLAAAEMGRVLAPGGRAVISVPVGHELVEGVGSPHTRSFERRYDEAALRDRLVRPSGLVERKRVYFGEPGLRFSRAWYGLPAALRLPIRRLGGVFSRFFLRPLDAAQREHACGVCLELIRRG